MLFLSYVASHWYPIYVKWYAGPELYLLVSQMCVISILTCVFFIVTYQRYFFVFQVSNMRFSTGFLHFDGMHFRMAFVSMFTCKIYMKTNTDCAMYTCFGIIWTSRNIHIMYHIFSSKAPQDIQYTQWLFAFCICFHKPIWLW